MSVPEALTLYGAGSLLALGGLCALIRAILGRTVLDRMIASDVLLTTVVLLLGIEMIINNHTKSIPVMIGVSATAALATITVARFVRRREAEAGHAGQQGAHGGDRGQRDRESGERAQKGAAHDL